VRLNLRFRTNWPNGLDSDLIEIDGLTQDGPVRLDHPPALGKKTKERAKGRRNQNTYSLTCWTHQVEFTTMVHHIRNNRILLKPVYERCDHRVKHEAFCNCCPHLMTVVEPEHYWKVTFCLREEVCGDAACWLSSHNLSERENQDVRRRQYDDRPRWQMKRYTRDGVVWVEHSKNRQNKEKQVEESENFETKGWGTWKRTKPNRPPPHQQNPFSSHSLQANLIVGIVYIWISYCYIAPRTQLTFYIVICHMYIAVCSLVTVL